MIRYKFEKGPNYIAFEINPFDVAEYYGKKVKGAYERDLRSWLENNIKEWGKMDNRVLDAIPERHAVYWWVVGGEHYMAVFADGEGIVYKIDEPYGYDDVIMTLTRIRFYGCGLIVEIVNNAYDYIEFVLEDGTIVTYGSPKYDEIYGRILKCEEYSTSVVLS